MLIKYVYQNGTGDYNDITTAFNDMLSSGIAASGTITEYSMIVDGGSYSGTLSGIIPYSGNFSIIGSGTSFYLTEHINNIGGFYSSSTTPNLYIENFTIYSSGIGNIISVPSGFGLSIKDTQFINNLSGINNYGGIVHLDSVSSCGISGSSEYFLYNVSGGMDIVLNSTISNYQIGLYSNSLFLSNSNIHTNNTGLYYDDNFNIAVDNSLMHNIYKDIVVGSGSLYLNSSTFGNQIIISDAYVYSDGNIFSLSNNVSGNALTGSYMINSCLPFGDTLNPTLSGNNIIYADPKFNNISLGDYRLKFKQTEGSPCIELKLNLNYDDSISFNIDPTNLQIYDSFGYLKNLEFLPYTYVKDSTIILTDYNKEIKFAELKKQFKTLNYKLTANMIFDELNILTLPSFNINNNNLDSYPWEWDYKEISTTEIISDNKYIIPRTVVDIESIILNKININPDQIFYDRLVKENIKPYIIENFRGISYDQSQSIPGQTIIWILDGNNQSLIKRNAFTNEDIEKYPLLCPYTYTSLIQPSGLIYTGVNGEYYTYIKETDPTIEIKCSAEGSFKWIPTNLNPVIDLRGVLVFKDNIFITAGHYPIDIIDRSIVTIGDSIGKIFWYNTNDLFFNYTKSINQVNSSILSSGNCYPTDLTMYEDGTLMIADYLSTSGIFKYKLAYDYCLINSSYDNETKVILREYYNNIDL